MARKPRHKPGEATFDEEFDAGLTALACSQAPVGYPDGRYDFGRHTRGMKIVDSISTMTVQRSPKNHSRLSKYWKIPPDGNPAFVAAREDVAVYCLPYDPLFPAVCMDQSSKQLAGEMRPFSSVLAATWCVTLEFTAVFRGVI